MPDVIDDMDELFKKAAENYPLNTNSSDWNEVYRALQASPGNLPAVPAKKDRSRRLLWLLLLIPFTFVIYKYAFIPVHQNTPGKGSLKKLNTSLHQQKVVPEQVNISKENLSKKSSPGSPVILSKRNSITIALKNGADNILAQHNNLTARNIIPTKKSVADNLANTADNEGVAKTIKNKGNKAAEGNAVNTEEGAGIPPAGINETGINKSDSLNQPAGNPLIAKDNKPLPVTDTLKNKKVTSAHKTNNRQQRFYAGIIAGPDLSSVKFQKVNKTGLTAGLILGYRINKKLSLESGLYLDKKYYYTEGKYFSTKNIPIPYTVTVVSLDGDCHMIELPFNVKYDFSSNKKTSWFALIGTSTYFMKKEDYNYELNSSGWLMEKAYSYKNSSTDWVSMINVSAGYTRNIGKTGMLRIEPYIKIPFKGVGIGSLPITSSGVYLGFTKILF